MGLKRGCGFDLESEHVFLAHYALAGKCTGYVLSTVREALSCIEQKSVLDTVLTFGRHVKSHNSKPCGVDNGTYRGDRFVLSL